MKLLIVGCSWAFGDELDDPSKECFSTIVGNRINAEVTNLGWNGISNHGIARKFLESDISVFDLVLVQMTQPSRTEYYDKGGRATYNKRQLQKKLDPNKFLRGNVYRAKKGLPPLMPNHKDPVIKSSWENILVDREHFMSTGHIMDGKEWWIRYYEELYHDKYGESDEMLFFHLMKNKLTNMSIPHLMMTINKKTKMPFDLQLNKSKYPRAKGNHPNKIGHIMIARDIMNLL